MNDGHVVLVGVGRAPAVTKYRQDTVFCHCVVSQIAEAMTAATASGCEISVRCEPPRNVVTRARARRAMASCEAGVMILSPVLTKNQDGVVFQADFREGVVNAAVDAPR